MLQVAILIPFRNRHEHLPILFQHLVPMLQRQRLQFAFYVIEQVALAGSERQSRARVVCPRKATRRSLSRCCVV